MTNKNWEKEQLFEHHRVPAAKSWLFYTVWDIQTGGWLLLSSPSNIQEDELFRHPE